MDLRERANNDRRHPWELARAEFFCGLILGEVGPSPVHVLDVGAGDIFFAESLLALLPEGSSVTCVDTGYPESWLGERTLDGERRLVLSRETPEARYDWITLLDVLEHVEEDGVLLRSLVQRLASGGKVLISVPAWQPLYTKHDTALGHVRRYSPAQLLERVSEARLKVDLHGGLFSSLLLPRSLSKLMELARGHQAKYDRELAVHIETSVGKWSGGRLLTSVILRALRWDSATCHFLARNSLAVPGLSTWAIAGREV